MRIGRMGRRKSNGWMLYILLGVVEAADTPKALAGTSMGRAWKAIGIQKR